MPKLPKITDEIIKICAENIRLGLTYTASAKAIGVTYQTWKNWEKLGAQGKEPYAKWYIEIQKAESGLMRDCLESVRMSMKLGDVKSAMFLLERRFGNDGYGKQSQVDINAKTENVNVNVNSIDEADKIRKDILSKLTPRPLPEGFK